MEFEKRHTFAKTPCYAHDGDRGLDLYSCESIVIPPFESRLVDTGIAIALPDGLVGLVTSKSGLALNEGLIVLNSPGVIDEYRGTLKVILYNCTKLDTTVVRGQKIAQLVIVPYTKVSLEQVDILPDSSRGENGFGSTGLI